MITNVDDAIKKFGLPTTIENPVAGSKISGVKDNLQDATNMENLLGCRLSAPTSFPLSVTGEFIYNKNINAVTLENINIKDPVKLGTF